MTPQLPGHLAPTKDDLNAVVDAFLGGAPDDSMLHGGGVHYRER